MGHMRSVADALIDALDSADAAAASILRSARGEEAAEPEELLILRSALVSTRNQWERLPDEALVASARETLAAAKSYSIEHH